MMQPEPRPLILTGLPRSGTTWSSRAIAAATVGRIVHEPFNWKHHPERLGYHMLYIPADAEDLVLLEILYREMKPKLLDRLRPNAQIVVKDVHICLALQYLSVHLDPYVIIMVRHPCAMAASWKSLGLEAGSRIDLLLSQEPLVRTFLAPYREHLQSKQDFYFGIGAYWGASYTVLREMSIGFPHWQWATHESLCVDMSHRYKQLLRRVGIDVTPIGAKNLEKFLLDNDRQRTVREGPYSLARASALEPEKWRNKLTDNQVGAVLAGAEPFGMLDFFDSVDGALV